MQMPSLFHEEMLAGVDRQIRSALANDFWTDDLSLIRMCVAPWEIPALFKLPTGDPTSVIDQFELQAICQGHHCASNPPGDDDWTADIDDPMSVPLFSPLDVWKAVQRHAEGDPGVVPPPITCKVDTLLRNMQRGYAAVQHCVPQLVKEAHDLDLLAEALTTSESEGVKRRLKKLIAKRAVWTTKTPLKSDAAEKYRGRYSETALHSLRKLLEVFASVENNVVIRWVSPFIIPLIENAKEFQDATQRPKWLLYKAVTICKGQLPDNEHNRMLAESIVGEDYVLDYLEFLKPASTFASYAESQTSREFLRQLREM